MHFDYIQIKTLNQISLNNDLKIPFDACDRLKININILANYSIINMLCHILKLINQ